MIRRPPRSTLFPYTRSSDLRNLRPEEIRVVLLHAGRLILPELPASLAEFAQRLLSRLGVEIRLETRRSEEHTSELQSRPHLVCRLLLEKKKLIINTSRLLLS